MDELPLSHRVYDRFWAACQDLDVPVAVHPGGARRHTGGVQEVQARPRRPERGHREQPRRRDACDPDEWNLAASAEYIGADRILWASDFPHPEYRPDTEFLGSLGISIAGGTSNIQRNIIAERGLGLPRDPCASSR